MTEILHALAALMIVGGAIFMLVAALGVYRLPDLMMRMHAATKAGTLGAGLLLLSVALFYGETGLTTRAIATILFLLLTAPVSAHAIGRSAYYSGVKVLTRVDELAEHYERERAGTEDAPSGAYPPEP
jgi:multicomponent Na+:H+ antiporter subunit G